MKRRWFIQRLFLRLVMEPPYSEEDAAREARMIHMLGDPPFDGRLIKHGDRNYELLKSCLRLCESTQGGERDPLHVGEPETSGLDGFRLVDVEKQYVVRAQLSKTKKIALS